MRALIHAGGVLWLFIAVTPAGAEPPNKELAITVASPFSDGLALVTTANRTVFVDRNGAVRIDLDRLFKGRVHAGQFSEGLAPIEINNGWGYIDKRGQVVIKRRFSGVEDFAQGRAQVRFGDGKETYAFIDRTGREIFRDDRTVHHLASSFSEGLAWVRFHDAPPCGFVDRSGKIVFRFDCAQMQDFHQGLASASVVLGRSVRWGFVDRTGKWVIPPRFDDAGWFSEGLAFVKSGKKGYIDREGRWVIKPRFQDAWEFSDGRARVKLGRRWGFIDRTGRQVIGLQFQDAWSFEGGVAMVRLDGQWGFVAPDGRWAVKPTFESARPFSSEGVAPVAARSEWGVQQPNGKVVALPGLEPIAPYSGFSEGLAGVRTRSEPRRQGFVDQRGYVVIKPRFTDAGEFAQERAMVCLDHGGNRRWGFIDRRGRLVIAARFNEVKGFSEGFAPVRMGPKWGYVNGRGNMVLKPYFADANPFSEGLASVQFEGKRWSPPFLGAAPGTGTRTRWGYVDRRGAMVFEVPSSYHFTGAFSGGLVRVALDLEHWGFMDRRGKLVVKPRYEAALDFSEGLAAVKLQGRWGYVNTQGALQIPTRYTTAESFRAGKADVARAGRPETIDTHGAVSARPEALESRFVQVQSARNGYIDRQGQWVLERLTPSIPTGSPSRSHGG